MKRHLLMHTGLIICLVILVGFSGMTWINYNTYGRIIKDDIENISKLTSSNIYAEIDSELIKPIYVSLTMANDTFLKNWLCQEQTKMKDSGYQQVLQEYLREFKEKYGYSSVFLVSTQSNLYYHYEGVLKKVSPENQHDRWYYKFIESGKDYDLDVDQDEADNQALTVFVNCRIESPEGTLMGVVGVGVKMNQLQSILDRYEKEFSLQTFLVNQQGVVQVHTDENRIETTNLLEIFPELRSLEGILVNQEALRSDWYLGKQQDKCLITRYIKHLEWYLVVEKDTGMMRKALLDQMGQAAFIAGLIVLALLSISSIVIRRFKNLLTLQATLDELTGLMNRRAFKLVLEEEIAENPENETGPLVFVFDIDYFKRLNDTQGHLFGDYVLKTMGQLAKSTLGEKGKVARWGGDEFLGILYGERAVAMQWLQVLREAIYDLPEFKKYNISASFGATFIGKKENLDAVLARADQGLYVSKSSGRNCINYVAEKAVGKGD